MLGVNFFRKKKVKRTFSKYFNIQGLIMGMTQYTTKAHIVRAALEGICYQTREVKNLNIFFANNILSMHKLDC